ncbi:MAG: division/cell wall cluster transcriptional repressor MraZ [Gammaproteobacteria bacterium]|nr:division/cell wall cluster transcriptional repressor MraZ [Gammaproteobacteria bacterium]
MFRGESALNMDEKGRMAVPSRYREQLHMQAGGRLVITIGLQHRCLTVYPFPDWQRIESELERLPAFDDGAEAVRHLLIGHATECDLDSHGRILVPQSLREFASLGKRVKMIGQASKFELWDDGAWAARREEWLGQVIGVLRDPPQSLRELVL